MMINKGRSLYLYKMLKDKLHEKAPSLVPLTDDVTLDGEVYAASKAALPGFEFLARKWPRPCKLLCGEDEHGEPQFFYVQEHDEPGVADEPHCFVQFVLAIADECNIPARAARLNAGLPIPQAPTERLPPARTR